MEQILKEKLGVLSVSYLERATSWMIAMGASMPNVKMGKPLKG
jgi:hypothetical protein